MHVATDVCGVLGESMSHEGHARRVCHAKSHVTMGPEELVPCISLWHLKHMRRLHV